MNPIMLTLTALTVVVFAALWAWPALRPHVRYLRYVLVHKFYVYRAGRVLGLGHKQLIMHDLSKFSRAEWGPYVAFQGYHGRRDAAPPDVRTAFDRAWEHHYTHNRHHPNFWKPMRGEAVLMPAIYVREMAADLYGAGMAQGKPDVWAWYRMNGRSYPLHPVSRRRLESHLWTLEQAGLIPADKESGDEF